MKKIIPANSLGDYIIKNDIASIEIYAMTGIATSDISRYKNGEILPLPAERVYLISLMFEAKIDEFLLKIYPKVSLRNSDKPPVKTESLSTTPFGQLLSSLGDDTIEIISYRTGITIKRLKDLSSKTTAVILGHELLLIELATDALPGTYFKQLFGHLKLNSQTVAAQLRKEENNKSKGKAEND